jgi:DNA-binding NarL/FixJ family response regulator
MRAARKPTVVRSRSAVGPGPEALRVVVASRHEAFSAGVRAALEADGIDVCAEAGDGAEAAEEVARNRPDVVLVDLALSGGGIATVREIAERTPDTWIIVVSDSMSDEQLFAALDAGADGYLLKDIAPRGLGAAVRGIAAGEAAIPRGLVATLIHERRRRKRLRSVSLPGRESVTLTERQWDVVQHLCSGASTARTAEALGITPVTVRRHISEIVRKLEAPTTGAALRLLSMQRSDRGLARAWQPARPRPIADGTSRLQSP